MKMLMMDMMSAMMPYMKPILYVGTGLLLIGLVVILFNMKSLFGHKGSDLDNAEERGSIGIIGKSVAWFGAFFLACEVAGAMLSMKPGFALFADPKNFDFGYSVRFWQVGLLFVIIGIVYWLLSRRSATMAA